MAPWRRRRLPLRVWAAVHAPLLRALGLAALGLAGLVAGEVGRAHAQDFGQPIAAIGVDGNRTSEKSLILSRFPLTVGEPYNPTIAREGIKALYGLGLFSDVKLLAEPRDGGQVALLIRVVERQRLALVEFRGNKELSADELKGHITLSTGQLYDPSAVEAARNALLGAYKEEGFPLVHVTVETTERAETNQRTLAFVIAEGNRVRLRSVNFLGNERVSGDDLRKAMKSRPKGFLRSGKFEQQKIEEDLDRLRAYYRDHGYRDAEIVRYDTRFPQKPEDLVLDIEVKEGPLYYFKDPVWTGNDGVIDENGNEAVPDALIQRLVPWKTGEPYSAAEVGALSGAITEAYTERGYLLGFRVADDESVERDSVTIRYTISAGEPSRVGEIRIAGNARTKERVIRRELQVYPGDVFRRSNLMRSQRDIFALGYFDDVQVKLGDPKPSSNDIDLEFTVQERQLGTAGAGVGFSSATGVTGFLQLGHNNLFGNGWSTNIHLERGSKRSQYEISFTEPWLFDRPISAGIELFDQETERDVFDDRRQGVGLNIGWPMPHLDYTRGFADLRVQKIEIPFIDSSLSEEAAERLRDGTGTIVSTEFGITRNTTDNPFHPTSGSRTSWSSEFSGGILGGSVDFQKHMLDQRTYVRPFWKPVVMTRVRLGVLQPYTRGGSVPGYETFRLGGTLFNYLRGYDDYDVVPEENITVNSLGQESRFPGGRYMATFTMEYQFPIAEPLSGLFFLDMGDTWNALNDISLSGFKRGAGAGLRMRIPMLGLVGLDYAYGFDRDQGAKWKPHLIIGREF